MIKDIIKLTMKIGLIWNDSPAKRCPQTYRGVQQKMSPCKPGTRWLSFNQGPATPRPVRQQLVFVHVSKLHTFTHGPTHLCANLLVKSSRRKQALFAAPELYYILKLTTGAHGTCVNLIRGCVYSQQHFGQPPSPSHLSNVPEAR